MTRSDLALKKGLMANLRQERGTIFRKFMSEKSSREQNYRNKRNDRFMLTSLEKQREALYLRL